jgi:hypothetical protein
MNCFFLNGATDLKSCNSRNSEIKLQNPSEEIRKFNANVMLHIVLSVTGSVESSQIYLITLTYKMHFKSCSLL